MSGRPNIPNELDHMTPHNEYNVSAVTLDEMAKLRDAAGPLDWNCLFVLPEWLKPWCDHFNAEGAEILVVRENQTPVGIAPLRVNGDRALFLGGTDVCDYQDVIVAPERESEFFPALLNHLASRGVTMLDLEMVRPDSAIKTRLPRAVEETGGKIAFEETERCYETDLPDTWDDYLMMLKGKQRHEVRRKIRRLEEAGRITRRIMETADDIALEMESFLGLFRSDHPDKAAFMTSDMEGFFRFLLEETGRARLASLSFLDIDGETAAGVICFDFNGTRYLYNSGFDARFSSVSAGLVCKIFSIEDAIEKGMTRYNFLKGDEVYKKRLGGTPTPLFRCRVRLDR